MAALSRRGQLTVAALGLLFVLAAGSWLFAPGTDPGSVPASAPDPAQGIRKVAEPGAGFSSAPRPAPDGLFTHLPVGLDDYEAFKDRGAVEGSPIFHQFGDYRVEYAFDRELTRRISRVLKRGRVKRGHVIALDTRTGRVLAYVSTDTLAFPPEKSYPAASLVKVVTAAAALQLEPESARRPCLYNGNQYRLTPSRVHRPRRGNKASLERALATSNNQCFAQLAVDTVGSRALLSSIEAFGWLASPGPGHAPGSADAGKSDYDLGRLGCGLGPG